jgi:hypothetical protein
MAQAVRADALRCQGRHRTSHPQRRAFDERVNAEARHRLPAAIDEDALLRRSTLDERAQLAN